jgi:glycogen phosphorylase
MQPLGKQKIAYFSMEIALSNDIHTYSGGLGVLAGDTLKSSADLRLPMLAVTLISKKGYFRQELTDSGKQIEHEDPWDPSKPMQMLPAEVKIPIQSRDVRIRAWLYNVASQTGGVVPIYLLDTDVEGNNTEDREITSYLYGGDERYRLKQEIVLGIGGVRMLEEIGAEVRKYHMNEGHSSLLAFELLRKYENDVDRVRGNCIFTTHTPVEAGHDKFSYDLVHEMMGNDESINSLKKLGGEEQLNMTRLGLNLSNYVNGVAKRTQRLFKRHVPRV